MSTSLKVLIGICIGVAAAAVICTVVVYILKYNENMAAHKKPIRGVPLADKMTMVAHRGMGSVAPENSLAAFEKAGENAFDYCECDIHATADGVFVISHDPTINRMTDTSGEIALMRFEEIRKARINNGSNHKIYSDQKVPTLEEYLNVCKRYGMHPVIEIKLKSGFDAKAFCDILRSKGFDKKAVVIGYNVEFLRNVREILPEVKLQILCHNISKGVIEQAQSIGNCGIDVMHNLLRNKKLINDAVSKGIELNSWTVDTPRTLKRMYDLGIRMATTNCIVPVKE